MSPTKLKILQHAIGVDQWGQGEHRRNSYMASGRDILDCTELTTAGLMQRHDSPLTPSDCAFFTVTLAGREAICKHSPTAPKRSPSQRRYQAWLDLDCDQNFGDWLKDPYWNDYRTRCNLKGKHHE